MHVSLRSSLVAGVAAVGAGVIVVAPVNSAAQALPTAPFVPAGAQLSLLTGSPNLGAGNEGNFNTGFNNDGDFNTGTNNRGVRNFGANNTGALNVGLNSTGNFNVGIGNTGNGNIGLFNTGDNHIGVANVGIRYPNPLTSSAAGATARTSASSDEDD